MGLVTTANITLTQAAIILVNYIVFYFIILLVLGPIVDLFTIEVASSLPLTPWGQKMMAEFLIYGVWFYWVLKAILALTILWFFIFIIRRNRYTREGDEYDLYR